MMIPFQFRDFQTAFHQYPSVSVLHDLIYSNDSFIWKERSRSFLCLYPSSPPCLLPPTLHNSTGRARGIGKEETLVTCCARLTLIFSHNLGLVKNCRSRCHCGRWARRRDSHTRWSHRGRSDSIHGPGSIGRWQSRVARCRSLGPRRPRNCPGHRRPRRLDRHSRCW